MLSSSQQFQVSPRPDTANNSSIEDSAIEVEIGTDPLSLSNAQTPAPTEQVSLFSEYSLCGDATQFMTPRGRGDISPAEAALGYVVPKDYPKDLGMDNELKLTGTKESYIMAEKPPDSPLDQIYFLGTHSLNYPKGTLDFNNIDMKTPGDKYEKGLGTLQNSISNRLYPELPSPIASNNTSTKEKSPCSSYYRPRVNPFSDKNIQKKKHSTPPVMEDPTTFCSTPDIAQSAPLDYSSAYPGCTGMPPTDKYLNPTPYVNPNPHNNIPNINPKHKPIKSHGQTSDVDGIDEVVTFLRGSFNNAIQSIGSLAGNNFDSTSSISFLGRFYFGKHQHEGRRLDTESVDDKVGTFQDFLVDFQSRIWITYRRGFPCLEGTSLTSDTGWGCMLRTGQMMLATTLQIHYFGRGWRRNRSYSEIEFRNVVKQFGDDFEHPFSIQRLLKIGKNHLNKRYGEWYGPSTVAYVLRVCVDEVREKIIPTPMVSGLVKNFVVYTATDCMLFKQDIINLATDVKSKGYCAPSAPTKYWIKTLLLVSVRMGADELNPSYRPAIEEFLSSPMCVGIMGGRKRHSLYFTGFQGSKLIHFDPHYCQHVIKMDQDFSSETYVCTKPRKMAFSKMDPSCTFGFYLRSQSDLEELIRLSKSVGEQKVFEILDGTKEEYLSMIHDPCIKAFRHNESMFDESYPSLDDIGSLEGSDFEYLD